MKLSERDDLILEAALEFGADYFYNIKNGTLGPTLYIEAPNRFASSNNPRASTMFLEGLICGGFIYNRSGF